MRTRVVGIMGISFVLAILAVCAWACGRWIWIQSPGGGGEPLLGKTTVEAGVAEGYTPASVEFFADDKSIGTDTTSPFSISWDTSKVANGEHKLYVTGTLTATTDGKQVETKTKSETVTVEVKNPEEPPSDTE